MTATDRAGLPPDLHIEYGPAAGQPVKLPPAMAGLMAEPMFRDNFARKLASQYERDATHDAIVTLALPHLAPHLTPEEAAMAWEDVVAAAGTALFDDAIAALIDPNHRGDR